MSSTTTTSPCRTSWQSWPAAPSRITTCTSTNGPPPRCELSRSRHAPTAERATNRARGAHTRAAGAPRRFRFGRCSVVVCRHRFISSSHLARADALALRRRRRRLDRLGLRLRHALLRHFVIDNLTRSPLSVSLLAPSMQLRASRRTLKRRRCSTDRVTVRRLRTRRPAVPLTALALRTYDELPLALRTIEAAPLLCRPTHTAPR